MKKTFYSMLLLAFTCVIPSQVCAEEMLSWEGTYCDQVTDNCMRIYEQGINVIHDGKHYAQIMFYTQKSNAFIAEGELTMKSSHEGDFYLLHLVPSEDRKNIKVDVNPYFSSWGDDSISNYGESLLFGNYIRVE